MNSLHKESHTRRYRQITEVLARHGLGFMVARLGLERFLPFHHSADDNGSNGGNDSLAAPRHVRVALEELGTTFIKLGQLLSTRPDLLSPDYIAELSKLQDDAPPFSVDAVLETIETDIGRPIEDIFLYFEPAPLAAASIGQVHAAALKDGFEVVVKVRRPGVVDEVEQDLEILQNLAVSAERHWDIARRNDLVGLVQEFASTLRAELDYVREARNAERFALNFEDDPDIHIPAVVWETTTPRVLTLERIRGIKVSDLEGLDFHGIDRSELADRGTRAILRMIFEHGFFHADLHPGNFFVEPDGRFGLVDFGMVGTVDEKTQDYLAALILALTSQDYERLADAMMELDIARRRVDRKELTRDLENLIKPYYGLPLGAVRMAPLFNEGFTVIRRHHMHLPPNLALLIKTIIVTEGIGTQLDPDFHLTDVIEPYSQHLVKRIFSPRRMARKLGRAGVDVARLGVSIPKQLRQILGEIERGGIEIGMRPGTLDPLMSRLERLANRIILGVIASAFIVGMAVLLSVYRPPGWERWAGKMFAAGFLFASGLGAYLAWTILFSGRRGGK